MIECHFRARLCFVARLQEAKTFSEVLAIHACADTKLFWVLIVIDQFEMDDMLQVGELER